MIKKEKNDEKEQKQKKQILDKNEPIIEEKTTEHMERVTQLDMDLHGTLSKSEIDKAFIELFSEENIEKKTEFKPKEINKITTLYAYALKYNLTVLSDFIKQNMSMRISIGRKGRKELVEIVQAQREHERLLATAKLDKHLERER